MRYLVAHRDERGDGNRRSDAQLLRYRNGRTRIGRKLPWIATQGISAHRLRHTIITWVERTFGYTVARAYAGHSPNADAGSTATYVKADLTGEPHPLGLSQPGGVQPPA